MDKEKQKQFFEVLQGKLPNEREMRNRLPEQFKELKRRLQAVEEINTQGINIVKKHFQYLESEFGRNIIDIYLADDMHLKEVYKILNFELISFIEQAEEIKRNKEHEQCDKNIEKELGE